ncbi:uncharacterized protein LOC123533677 [Mercenaria mercenaria]|uniref:uncharacterized protein LOC123533677 n=1 Tax=Mercenaria mercenaria TaxID=6596 RepID=UPI001E1E0535|nr:uncharacterized protein LOC123533677 [Mercenaria mercenaria]XP_045171369.1 uncharacterized protein LOC123533677 [Mercenaria mercenaria]XP_045171370.1 uncharacterized protein LOC123533677 [Mercenaria mercenaria]
MSKLLVVGILACLSATIISIISTAIPYWEYLHGSFLGQEGTLNIGLWRTCIKYKTSIVSGSACSDTQNDEDWWKAVQSLMILGNVFLALSTLLGCLYYKNSTQSFIQGTVFTALLGGVVLITAVIVFGVEEKEHKSSFSASFILAIVSGVLAFIAGGLVGISKRGHPGYSSI